MAPAHTLAGKGARIEAPTVDAAVTPDEGWVGISAVDLDVRGTAAGLPEEEFRRAAEEAVAVRAVSNVNGITPAGADRPGEEG